MVGRFLDVLWGNKTGMKKTPLQMAVRLNYSTFRKYLKWLHKHQLVKIFTDNEGNDKIILSTKGKKAHLKLVEWIKETMKDIKL